MLNNVDKSLLEKIADMPEGAADGAYNIRKDCGCASRAVTENINIETKTDKPGINNLITIYSVATGKTPEQIEAEFEGKGYGDFKTACGEAVVEMLRPFREQVEDLMKNN